MQDLINQKLPNELLIAIFLALRDHECKEHYSMRWTFLRHVCRRWREILLNTPLLWTQIYLHPGRLTREAVRMCFELSRPLAGLDFWVYLPCTHDATTILSELVRYPEDADRISKLTIVWCEEAWRDAEPLVEMFLERMNRLVVLELVEDSCQDENEPSYQQHVDTEQIAEVEEEAEQDEEGQEDGDDDDANRHRRILKIHCPPTLRCLTLENVFASLVPSGVVRIHKLSARHTDRWYTDDMSLWFVDLLRQCPSLRCLILEAFNPPMSEHYDDPDFAKVVLPNLEVLSILDYYDKELVQDLLKCIILGPRARLHYAVNTSNLISLDYPGAGFMYAFPEEGTVERARFQQDTTLLSLAACSSLRTRGADLMFHGYRYIGHNIDQLFAIDVHERSRPFNEALLCGLREVPQLISAANIVELDLHLFCLPEAVYQHDDEGDPEPLKSFFSAFRNLHRLVIGNSLVASQYLEFVGKDPSINWTSLRKLEICGDKALFNENLAKALVRVFTQPSTWGYPAGTMVDKPYPYDFVVFVYTPLTLPSNEVEKWVDFQHTIGRLKFPILIRRKACSVCYPVL